LHDLISISQNIHLKTIKCLFDIYSNFQYNFQATVID